MTRVQDVLARTVLALTGATLAAVGASVGLAPQAFYGGYGITLTDGAPLLGELRASGLALLLLGVLVGAGAVRARLAATAALVGAVTMLGHAAGRVLSWLLDGGLVPGLAGAGAAELVLGAACGWVLAQHRAARLRDGARPS